MRALWSCRPGGGKKFIAKSPLAESRVPASYPGRRGCSTSGFELASKSVTSWMMMGSGALKSTPVKVVPMWNTAPPATTPGAESVQAGLGDNQVIVYLLYVTPLNTAVPLGKETVGLSQGLWAPA